MTWIANLSEELVIQFAWNQVQAGLHVEAFPSARTQAAPNDGILSDLALQWFENEIYEFLSSKVNKSSSRTNCTGWILLDHYNFFSQVIYVW